MILAQDETSVLIILNLTIQVLFITLFLFLNLFQYRKLGDETTEKAQILQEIRETVAHRAHLDGSIRVIGFLLFGPEEGSGSGSNVLDDVRPSGSPLVDDWECLKSMVQYSSLDTQFWITEN